MQRKLKLLESTFWFALVTHGIGLLTMAALVLPGMPGGPVPDAERIQYVAENQLLWQVGWLPWQLSALSDFLIAIAILQIKDLPFYLRALVMLATLFAIAPDQCGQIIWVRDGSRVATLAIAKDNLPMYLNFEHPLYEMVCGWAALFYSVLAAFWTLALKPILNASRTFYIFSWSIWALSGVCAVLFLLSSIIPIPFLVLAVANAVFFPLLLLWFAWVIEYLLKLQRPEQQWGRHSIWTLPKTVPFRFLFQIIGQSHFFKRIFELLRPISLASEIDGVVYVNYLVEYERLLPLVPAHLELQRLGPEGKYALFTILSFRHKQFGPQMLPPFRKTLNLQAVVSNWRIHVRDPETKLEGIHFVANVTDNVIVSLAARLLSEGMPMHVAESAGTEIAEGKYKVNLPPAEGSSAADLIADLELDDGQASLEEPWSLCFKDYNDFLNYCVPQDRAIASQPHLERISFQEIRLGIPLDKCRPLKGAVKSAAAESIVGKATPLCFAAPSLQFRFDREHYRSCKAEQLG